MPQQSEKLLRRVNSQINYKTWDSADKLHLCLLSWEYSETLLNMIGIFLELILFAFFGILLDLGLVALLLSPILLALR